jgi:hypothetical protein
MELRKKLRALSDTVNKGYEAAGAAEDMANASRLPGLRNGPADAYRHILWAAEMTRLLGEPVAGFFLWGHEKEGSLGSNQPKDEEVMDLHNNEIGIRIGLLAKTFEEVIAGARKAVETSDRAGSSATGARWLDRSRWSSDPDRPLVRWPAIDWSADPSSAPGYALGGERNRYNAPPRFPGDGSTPSSPDTWFWPSSLNNGIHVIDLKKKAALDRTRREARATGGGTVHVDAYTRMQDGKSVDVSAYDRSAPAHG